MSGPASSGSSAICWWKAILDFSGQPSYIAVRMVYQYVVTLRNTSRRYIDRFSLGVLLISVFFFLREQVIHPRIQYGHLLCSLLIAGMVGRNLLIRRNQADRTVFYSSALFIAAIGWVVMPFNQWLVLPFGLMGIFERQAKIPLEIGFSDHKIVFNTLLRRKYQWNDFNNIVLKDDLLTLDFKNNRLLQRETVDEEGDAGEDEFNDYCREQLAKAQSVIR